MHPDAPKVFPFSLIYILLEILNIFKFTNASNDGASAAKPSLPSLQSPKDRSVNCEQVNKNWANALKLTLSLKSLSINY